MANFQHKTKKGACAMKTVCRNCQGGNSQVGTWCRKCGNKLPQTLSEEEKRSRYERADGVGQFLAQTFLVAHGSDTMLRIKPLRSKGRYCNNTIHYSRKLLGHTFCQDCRKKL